MNEAELIFTALAELSTRQIAESIRAKGLPENAIASKKEGAVAKMPVVSRRLKQVKAW